MALSIEISEAADQDLEDIFDYTFEQHGVDQAVKYVSAFDDVFEGLGANPNLGRERPEIQSGLRSIASNHHIVFYRILVKRIRIVRVLHGSRDLPRQFPVS